MRGTIYHRAVEQAKGEPPIPRRAVQGESAIQAIQRLAAELSQFAAILETTFSEAAQLEFRLSESDAGLLNIDHGDAWRCTIDGACGEPSALPNAPAADFLALPAGGKDFEPACSPAAAACSGMAEQPCPLPHQHQAPDTGPASCAGSTSRVQRRIVRGARVPYEWPENRLVGDQCPPPLHARARQLRRTEQFADLAQSIVSR